MANKIADVIAYHNGKTFSIANLYDSTLAGASGHIKIRHNSTNAYLPLSNNQSSKQTPCLNVYHNGQAYFALKKPTLPNLKITSASVNYNSTGTITISGNVESGTVTASIPDAYSDCLKVQSLTTNTITVKCTKFTADDIPLTVEVAETASYCPSTATANVTTQKADPSITVPEEGTTITYGKTATIAVSGNSGKGTITTSIPSNYKDCFSVTSVTTSTVKVKCTKFTDNTVPITVRVAETTNYNAVTTNFCVWAAKADISPAASINDPVIYNSTGTITISGNVESGTVTATVPSAYSACLKVQSTTTNTVTLKCTKYTADTVAVTVKVAETANHTSATTIAYVTTAQTASSLSTSASPVTYNTTGTITITGNTGKAAVTAISGDTSCLTIESTTTNTVKVKCTKYKSSPVPVTINVASSTNYGSATTICNVTTQKADLSITVPEEGVTITYGETATINIGGNSGKGTVTATIPNNYKDYFSVTSVTTSTVKVKCTKYTEDTVPVMVKVAETTNYNKASDNFCVEAVKKALTSAQSTFSANAMTYNGSQQTASISGFNSTYHILSSEPIITKIGDLITRTFTPVNEATNAGDYTAAVALISDNYTWADGTSKAKKVSWAINKKSLTKPAFSGSSTFTYDGKAKSASITGIDSTTMSVTGISSISTTSKTNSQTDAGTYKATVALKDKTNYQWADSTTSTVNLNWTINKKTLACPTLSATSFRYDGKEKTVTIAANYDSDTMYIDWGFFQATEVNDYSIYVALHDSANYRFNVKTGESDDHCWLDWSITPALVTIPTLTGTYTYNGNQQSVTMNNYDSTLMTYGGDYRATNAGTYSVTFSLRDYRNYNWQGDISEDVSRNWTISPASGFPPFMSLNGAYIVIEKHSTDISIKRRFILSNSESTPAVDVDITKIKMDVDLSSVDDGSNWTYSTEGEVSQVTINPTDHNGNHFTVSLSRWASGYEVFIYAVHRGASTIKLNASYNISVQITVDNPNYSKTTSTTYRYGLSHNEASNEWGAGNPWT